VRAELLRPGVVRHAVAGLEHELRLRVEALGRQQSEQADLAVRVFELSQKLADRWDAADIAEKRRLLEILGLNWTLDGASLVGELSKPFDALAKDPPLKVGRGDWIRTSDFKSLQR
jgi:site-specific DNA recombinase